MVYGGGKRQDLHFDKVLLSHSMESRVESAESECGMLLRAMDDDSCVVCVGAKGC